MNNLKRFTVCKVMNHDWATSGKENHEAGTVARGAGPLI
jgi:hypothetical protein